MPNNTFLEVQMGVAYTDTYRYQKKQIHNNMFLKRLIFH